MTEDSHADVLANYRHVLAELTDCVAAAGLPAGAVQLVAVGKTYPAARMRPLLEAGHRVFGESRVYEAKAKWSTLREQFKDLDLHLIGPLQTNKLRDAVALFDVIETVDRRKLADGLAAEMAKSGRRPNCLIQVNTGAEPQKAGVLPDGADALIEHCLFQLHLPVVGLMCIPPQDQEPGPHFAQLASLAGRHALPVLSMGMSNDFPAAVRAGATLVRVGTAIFGHRTDR